MNDFPCPHAGAEWMARQLKYARPEMQMSDFGRRVANLLGEVFFGIYHLNHTELYRADWSNEKWIEISVGWKPLATYDFNELTRLVFLAHEMQIRVELDASTHKYMRYRFHDSPKHPSLEKAVALFRTEYALKAEE